MNLPNKITLIRILLIPLIVVLYLLTPIFVWGRLIAVILFSLACFTDFLDGYIARKYNLVTTLGKFLDTIADKLLTIIAFLLIVCDETILMPYGEIALIIVIIRELVVSALRQLAASKNVIIAADMWGKVKANFQFFTIIAFMLYGFILSICSIVNWLNIFFIVVCYSLLVLTVVSTILSGLHYITKNKKVFKEN